MKYSSLTEPIGFIAGIAVVLTPIFQGKGLYLALRDYALFELTTALALREFRLVIFGVSALLIAGVVVTIIKKVKKREIQLIGGVLVGFSLAQFLIYVLLNTMFFRGAFVILPFLIGNALFISSLMELFPTSQIPKSRFRKMVALKLGAFMIVGIVLFTPSIPSLVGFAPDPPPKPQGLEGPYTVVRWEMEQQVNSTLLSLIDSEQSTWLTYIYVPQNFKGTLPVLIFLHGHSGEDPKYYDRIIRTVSSQGVLGIFVQYPPNYDEAKVRSFIKGKYSNELIPENVPRYLQEWDGILQALTALNDTTTEIGTQFRSAAPEGYDLSRLMIAGHSLGGGMVLYITTKVRQLGWGENRFIMDIEAGWVASMETDMTLLPDHTLVNVVVYEDDQIVPACISVNYFERIRSRDGKSLLQPVQLSYIVVQSDFHGFPRDLANHYSATDLITDNIYYRAVLRRLGAMGAYLVDGSQRAVFMDDTDMGEWSDGTPFTPLRRTTDPLGFRGDKEVARYVDNYYSDDYCSQ